MNKKYFPSRKFVASVVIIIIAILIIFGVYEITTFFKHRIDQQKLPTKLLVKDLVQKDTNKNGIPDWEESLWGLDPNINGTSNKEFILSKREALAKDTSVPDIVDNTAPSKENEVLSQEFFAVVMSLEQTGNLDDASLKSISDAIGKKIDADPIADIYTKNMTTIIGESSIETVKYYTAYINLNNKYRAKNIGDELSFVATALRDNDQGALKLVGKVGEAYKSLGKELIKIPVPSNLLSIHISLANDYEKVAQSINGLTELLSNPIIGMRALINYKKYSDALVNDIGTLSDNFK